jgi:hypothetical protein
MRNLKSDLPIRPIYLHRDDAIIAFCFVCVLALTVYTLIERDCQANPVLVEAGLRTTDEVLNVLSGFCVSVHLTPSGYEVFWPDTPTEKQKLIWRQLQIPDPETRMPDVRSASQEADSTQHSAFLGFVSSQRTRGAARNYPIAASIIRLYLFWTALRPIFGLVKCLSRYTCFAMLKMN